MNIHTCVEGLQSNPKEKQDEETELLFHAKWENQRAKGKTYAWVVSQYCQSEQDTYPLQRLQRHRSCTRFPKKPIDLTLPQSGRQTYFAQRDFCHVEPLQGKKGGGLACRNCSVDRDRHTTITTPEFSGENSDVSQSRTRMMTMIITTTMKYRRDRIRAPLL